ncbi:MAG TPA: hypothetical protein PKB13_02110 [Clostridia bacterium]|nr:hypothetical protein [Clostridia bacterium]
MKQNRKIIAYYKRRLYGGRNAFARGVDFFALRAITLAACYLWFSTVVQNTVMALLLSATALITISVAVELYKSIRLDKFIARERAAMRDKMFGKRLCMMPREEFLQLVQACVRESPEKYGASCLVYPLQQASPANADTVLNAYRAAKKRGCTAAVIFSASGASRDAEELLEQYTDTDIRFEPVSSLITQGDKLNLLPDEAAVNAQILSSIEAEKKRRLRLAARPFQPGRTKRYILVAAALFVASFFVKHTLYYRLLSAACVSFGAIAWWLNTLSVNKSQLRR